MGLWRGKGEFASKFSQPDSLVLMHEFSSSRIRFGLALGMALGGGVLAGVAWMLPVNLLAMPPALLQAAGQGTASMAVLGEKLLGREKLGPASLVWSAATAVEDPAAAGLEEALAEAKAAQPELVPWTHFSSGARIEADRRRRRCWLFSARPRRGRI
jgi:hypothetical protein